MKKLSESSNGPIIVHKFTGSGNAKALDAALKQLKSEANMVFCVDSDSGKALCLASVSQVGSFVESYRPI